MFKWLKDIYHKETPFPKRTERLVAYVSRHGKILMWPERIDPKWARGVYGFERMPHLDEPKEKVC